jgi:hypothetical protein
VITTSDASPAEMWASPKGRYRLERSAIVIANDPVRDEIAVLHALVIANDPILHAQRKRGTTN